MLPFPNRNRYRAIWISDVHLGTRGCKAELLLKFLRSHECDRLYLVGDIIDFWRLKKAWFWLQSHNDVVLEVMRKAKHGTEVVYIPGNHDEGARDYCALQFANIKIVREDVHETADGRRLLVIHGDEFDCVVKYAKWLAMLGDGAYQLALGLNHWFNEARRHLGLQYWSLSAYLKSMVKDAVKYIDSFECALADEARRRGLDGVICGHIHRAEIRPIGDVLYCNSGDWVESCTALAEDERGRFRIIHWTKELQEPAPVYAVAS
ncbi:MAG: UDP-2,3-diacylglucosamine diphosphatase [Acidobacteriia bacterium]|nr:UDP-2,3-diacylglucosamine diphosphatase [Terriglobia bacterium]